MYLQYVIDAETAQVARALGCAPHFSSWAVLQPDRESERARERERERERERFPWACLRTARQLYASTSPRLRALGGLYLSADAAPFEGCYRCADGRCWDLILCSCMLHSAELRPFNARKCVVTALMSHLIWFVHIIEICGSKLRKTACLHRAL